MRDFIRENTDSAGSPVRQSSARTAKTPENTGDFADSAHVADCFREAADSLRNSSSAPFGADGPKTQRDERGRFILGNTDSVLTGERSRRFWQVADAVRRDIRRAVIADAGHMETDAPRALSIVADGLAQATIVRDSAFERLLELGGPQTTKDRARRSFSVWLAAGDRVEKYARLVSVHRVAKPAPSSFAERLSEIQPVEAGTDDN